MCKKLLVAIAVAAMTAACSSSDDEVNLLDKTYWDKAQVKAMKDSLDNHIVGTWVCDGVNYGLSAFYEIVDSAKLGVVESCPALFEKAPSDTIIFRADSTITVIRVPTDSHIDRLVWNSYTIKGHYSVSAGVVYDIKISYERYSVEDEYESLVFEKGYNTLYLFSPLFFTERYIRLTDDNISHTRILSKLS